MKMTGAQQVLAACSDAGVDHCFCNPGTTEMWFVAAFDRVPTIRPVLCLHETVCTGAADGYARMARKPAATLLHLGPGLCNGLANLHNARRAGSRIINIIGEMATWHKEADPVLNMDMHALAGSVSAAHTTLRDGEVGAMQLATALRGQHAGGGGELDALDQKGRVVSIIVPHDISWAPEPLGPVPKQPAGSSQRNGDGLTRFIRDCASALLSCRRGGAALYIGGDALLMEGDALRSAGLVAAATGSELICESFFARVERGAGLAHLTRLPYFPQEATQLLGRFEMLVVVGTRLPVAPFGYDGGPSQLVQLPEEKVWHMDGACNAATALQLLAQELHAADKITPGKSCGGRFVAASRPPMPQGQLTAAALCAVVAALQPHGTILVDESLTSGGSYWEASKGCPPFTHITLTGGAIGSGPPLALGASLACPDRPVINLQADGSAMYSLQALWSQSREGLHIITIICANNSYAILKIECSRQRVPSAGRAARLLTDLSTPAIDWVALAHGMGVPASRATTAEALAEQLVAALHRPGPHLIQAMLE